MYGWIGLGSGLAEQDVGGVLGVCVLADRGDLAVGIAVTDGAVNLGLDRLISDVRADRRRFSLLPADVALPAGAGVRSVPLADPTPLYAWSLIWLSQDRHPLLGTLLRRFAETGIRRRWLEYDAARDWLPAHDQAELRRAQAVPAAPGHAGQ